MGHILATARRKDVRWTPSTKSIERVFDVLATFAEYGQVLPPNYALIELLKINGQNLNLCVRQLDADRRIDIEYIGGNGRKITILTGVHAGKVTETGPRQGKAPIKTIVAAAPASPPKAAPPTPHCQWCGEKMKARRSFLSTDTCSMNCKRQFGKYHLSAAQVEARRAHVATQPKGAKSLDEFIQMGGRIYVEPPRQRYGAGA